uniref:protein Shroom1 isoform X3 n=1 Tax=Panthera onca TaxID=9690 RepID=UPI0029542B1C|nr:protein Shroom1 isoform X3 [Panthera onca]
MEALGPGRDRASPASSTRSLDLRRLSARADSAYSSFSAASGAPEPRTPSPGTDLLPYLDWDYVRVVWGGPASAAPAAGLRASPQPRPASAARSGLRLPEVQGTSGPLSRQATPLLFALAAEAEARAVEPPSPPASRAAYRQRLQGAQRRVLRETSFQRKELRMSLPARLRPAAPARPPAAHPRSASLSHPGGEVEPGRSGAPARGPVGRGRLATQQRKWCFSEPGKLDRVGQGGGSVGGCSSDASSSSGFAGPEPQERRVLAELEDHQIRWLPETQPRSTEDPEPRSLKFGDAHRPSSRSRSSSGEVLAPWGGSGGVTPVVQVAPQGAETPRLLFQSKLPRFLTQKEAAVLCPAECLQSSPADHEQRVSETCLGSARLPSLPDDEVFLEDVPLVRMRSPPDTHVPTGNPTSVHVSDQQYETSLGQGVDQAGVPPEHPLHEHPETAGADDSWRRINGSVSISRTTCCSPPGTANGDIPTFNPTGLLTIDPLAATDPLKPLPVDALEPPGNSTPGALGRTALAWGTGQPVSRPTWRSLHLEELVQELARLDPSMSDILTSCPSPEPPLGLLDGLIPLAEVWAAMRPAGEEDGKDAVGTPEPGCYLFSSSQLRPTSQMRSENHTTHPVPDQRCGQGLPDPNSIEAKKMELANLLQKMLRDLQAEQERLHRVAQAWARRGAALEAAVGQTCAPRDLERFSRFMADLERVLGLLLLLGSRLARVRRALAREGADGDPDEQASLLQRLGLLKRQQEDAKELKEHVARRERALREVLVKALPAEELRAYRALLAGKAAVLAQQRSLDERVRLLQDQLDAVRSDLGRRPLPPRMTLPPETRSLDKPSFPPPLI